MVGALFCSGPSSPCGDTGAPPARAQQRALGSSPAGGTGEGGAGAGGRSEAAGHEGAQACWPRAAFQLSLAGRRSNLVAGGNNSPLFLPRVVLGFAEVSGQLSRRTCQGAAALRGCWLESSAASSPPPPPGRPLMPAGPLLVSPWAPHAHRAAGLPGQIPRGSLL